MSDNANRFFVVTGGPGSGKTTLIEALRAKGFATTREAGRGVIQQAMQSEEPTVPWLDRELFTERMFEWELASYRQAERETGPVFFDRGLPDTLGYLRLEELAIPTCMEEQAWRLRYSSRVFIAPPWKEIFGPDEERQQSWPVAVETYETMADIYTEFGYTLAELPRAPVADRVRFLLETLGLDS